MPKFYKAVLELPNPIARDYVLLLLFTGLRRSEGAALRWNEVDFAERLIRLPPSRTKAGRRLDLPMTSFVRELLVARRAIGNAHWVFPANSASGHIVEPTVIFDQIAQKCGIRVSAHDANPPEYNATASSLASRTASCASRPSSTRSSARAVTHP